jgi:hypothetical protein
MNHRRFEFVRVSTLLCVSVLLCGCASIADSGAPANSELEALRQQVKTLQEANTLLDLKLQEEIERSTIQLFLTRQEIAAAKREAAAVRTKCGPPCADVPP